MKKILALFTLFFTISLIGQLTIKDTLTMNKTSVKRSITVSLPASYNKDKTKTYPLLIVLDGDYLLAPFEGVLRYGSYWDDLPEMILVGIDQNTNEERFDDSETDDAGLPKEKGAAFFEFVGATLIDYINDKYRINNLKIIAGQDVTAGYLNFFLYKDAPIFNAYISLSPEFANNMESRLIDRLQAINQPIFYYVATADGDTKAMKDKTTVFNNAIKQINMATLNYKYEELKETSHYSMVLKAIPNALYYFFESYQPITTNEFQNKIVVLNEGYVAYLKARYEKTEKTLHYKIPVRYNDFKAIYAAIMKNKAYNELEELAQEANKNYPKSMLGDFYLASYYEQKGDLKRAIKTYLNAFQREPIGDLDKDKMINKSDDLRAKMDKQ